MQKRFRPYRKRDLVAVVLLSLTAPLYSFLPATPKFPLDAPFRLVALWWLFLAFLCLRGWLRYRRGVAPILRAQTEARRRALAIQQETERLNLETHQQNEKLKQEAEWRALEAQRRMQAYRTHLDPLLDAGHSYGLLDTGGIRLTTPSREVYHLYPLDPGVTVSRGQAVASQTQRQAAKQEGASLLFIGDGGGAPVAGKDEVVLPGGLTQLAEQVQFWDERAAATLRAQEAEQRARERGVEVEVQALAQLAGAFPGWRVRTGLLMRSGGDVDALLTRPDGRTYCVDVKSHRGPATLQDDVLHFGRDARNDVRRQLQR